MMIMTAIILLMAIYGEFTFESKISRIKATNVMDRSQAKLLAESGLQMAMTRLKLYKEALEYANEIYITEVYEDNYEFDTYFPNIDHNIFEIFNIGKLNIYKNFTYKFIDYKRKSYL